MMDLFLSGLVGCFVFITVLRAGLPWINQA